MRQVVQVSTLTQSIGEIRQDLILGVMDDGTLWLGDLKISGEEIPVVEWKPLNGPPDGEYFTKMAKPFWDRLEEKLRDEAATPPYAQTE